jgi:hypothetical protein
MFTSSAALRLVNLDAFLRGPAQCALFRNKYVVLATSDSSGQRAVRIQRREVDYRART